MTHEEMNELYELYVLGALEPREASEIDEHLAAECTNCLDNVRTAMLTTSALAGLTEPVEPAGAVRKKLLAALAPEPQRRFSWWIPVLAAGCACLVVAILWSNSNLVATRSRLQSIAGERDQLRTAVRMLTRPETRTIQFGPPTRAAHGRVLVNPHSGFVITGEELPEIAADRTFELWLVPADGQAPQPAGLFRADNTHSFVHVSQQALDTSKIAAVAVSVEPLAGSAAPTTRPFLIVPLS